MSITLFYSWQSDLPNKVNRNFIEDALERAIKRLGSDNTIQEAMRDTDIVLDRDTKGVPGTPPIVDVIFNKIAQCDIFVPDVTFVGKSIMGRPIPNPNVLIEYGWALRCLSHTRMLPIMNTAYGEPSETNMPFDMRHLRHPLTYCLKEDTTPEERGKVKEQLIKELEEAIKLMIPLVLEKTVSEEPMYTGRPSTTDPSTFLQPGETFIETRPSSRGGDKRLDLPEGQRLFLRLIPATPLKEITSSRILLDWIVSGRLEPMQERASGWTRDRNRHGAYVCHHDNGRILYFTQLFMTGEIWGIDTDCIAKEDLMAQAGVDRGFFPWVSVKKTFEGTLSNYLSFAQRTLQLSLPLTIKAGATKVEGYRMRAPSIPWSGSVVDQHITWESIIEDYTMEPHQILRPFFNHVWEECGLERPDQECLG
jgi:hypothetical protein